MFSLLNKVCDKLGLSFRFGLEKVNSPTNKVSLRGTNVGSIIQTSGDVHVSERAKSDQRPQMDIERWGGTGSGEGTFVEFYVKNIGEKVAMDVVVELVADDLERGIKIADAGHSLAPGQTSRLISYRYDKTEFFKRALKNPQIVIRYNEPSGHSFVSGRGIMQAQRADERFNIHTEQPLRYFER